MQARENATTPEDDGPISGVPHDTIDEGLAEYLLENFAPLPRLRDIEGRVNNRLMDYIRRGVLPVETLYEGHAPDYKSVWDRILLEIRCEEIDRALENIARAIAPEWPIDWRYDRP